ncbi:MAG: C4-dicarboxylic acid transporter DauA [Polyangiaceae bacterium]|nr:C4-dicarboxylic acid transporter DauA [Polyangiaceae bacterium]
MASALRRALGKGYGARELRADVLAGLVVGIVALPLSMALAIAVGAPPQHGLYTAIVAGATVALAGGCKFQVTGPTAAFIVILAPIVTRHGLSGLLTAGFMAGVMLVAMGAARLGSLIKFIPHPVTTGFTTGIAAVIATLQIKDIFGLSVPRMPEHYVEKVAALWEARGSASSQELLVAAATLALLLVLPRVTKRIPAPLIAISAVAASVAALHALSPSVSVATIGSRFHTTVGGVEVAGIPSILPSPALPWGTGLSWQLVRDLFPPAFAIAMLGAIESLLSAVIADGMTGTKHDPNSELIGLGLGNLIAPVFGGIAATGALARTATNIRAGARSPLAAVIHALVVLLAMLFLAPLVAYVPMASLAALLLLVAWNMSEIQHFLGVARIAPKSDVLVLVTCFLLTVFFDMVVAVSVGFVLAAILFMRRMAEITDTKLAIDNTAEHGKVALPPGVGYYEVNGPLFFGAAQNAMDALHASRGDTFRVLILHLGRTPVIDATGFAALESAIEVLMKRKKTVILAGPLPRPRTIFERAKLHGKHSELRMADDLDSALTLARELAA